MESDLESIVAVSEPFEEEFEANASESIEADSFQTSFLNFTVCSPSGQSLPPWKGNLKRERVLLRLVEQP